MIVLASPASGFKDSSTRQSCNRDVLPDRSLIERTTNASSALDSFTLFRFLQWNASCPAGKIALAAILLSSISRTACYFLVALIDCDHRNHEGKGE